MRDRRAFKSALKEIGRTKRVRMSTIKIIPMDAGEFDAIADEMNMAPNIREAARMVIVGRESISHTAKAIGATYGNVYSAVRRAEELYRLAYHKAYGEPYKAEP